MAEVWTASWEKLLQDPGSGWGSVLSHTSISVAAVAGSLLPRALPASKVLKLTLYIRFSQPCKPSTDWEAKGALL